MVTRIERAYFFPRGQDLVLYKVIDENNRRPYKAIPTVTGWDLTWHVIATGDFNHDGITDVVWDNGNGVRSRM